MPQRTIDITYPVLAAALGLDPHIRIEHVDQIVYGDGRRELVLRVASDAWSLADPLTPPLRIDETTILPANALREARLLAGIMQRRFGAVVADPLQTALANIPSSDEVHDVSYTFTVPARGVRGQTRRFLDDVTDGDIKAAQIAAIEAEFLRAASTILVTTDQPLRRLALTDVPPLPVPTPVEEFTDEQATAAPSPQMSTPYDEPNPFAGIWQTTVADIRNATAVAERSLYGLAVSPLVAHGWDFPVLRPRDPQQLYSYYDPQIYQVWSREHILAEAWRPNHTDAEIAEADGGLVLRDVRRARWSLVSLICHDTPEPDLERLNRALVRPNRDLTVFGRPGVIRCRWCHSRLDWGGRDPYCMQCGGNL